MLSRALTHLTPPFPQPNPSPSPLSPLLSSTHTRPHFQPRSALSPISTLHGSTHIHARVKPSRPHLHPPSRSHSFLSYPSHPLPSPPRLLPPSTARTVWVLPAPLPANNGSFIRSHTSSPPLPFPLIQKKTSQPPNPYLSLPTSQVPTGPFDPGSPQLHSTALGLLPTVKLYKKAESGKLNEDFWFVFGQCKHGLNQSQ
jgi:hypothetical protein